MLKSEARTVDIWHPSILDWLLILKASQKLLRKVDHHHQGIVALTDPTMAEYQTWSGLVWWRAECSAIMTEGGPASARGVAG